MLKNQTRVNKYLNPANFKDLFIGYVGACTLASILIPENASYFHRVIHPFVEAMSSALPGINSLARQSETPSAIKAYYSLQWIFFPYIVYRLFVVVRPNPHRTQDIFFSCKRNIQLALYMVVLLCISALMFYMLAFHTYSASQTVDTIPRGRGEGLAMALTNKYTAGAFSSILHITLGTCLITPILVVRKVFIGRLKN